jgi:hypothetical protein
MVHALIAYRMGCDVPVTEVSYERLLRETESTVADRLTLPGQSLQLAPLPGSAVPLTVTSASR